MLVKEHEDKRTIGTSDCDSRGVSKVWSGDRACMPHDCFNGRQSGLMTNGEMKRGGVDGRIRNARQIRMKDGDKEHEDINHERL